MTVQLPTRITIELHPGEAGGIWTASTSTLDAVAAPMAAHVAEPRQEAPHPQAYESAPCTCLDDGGCHADHGNE